MAMRRGTTQPVEYEIPFRLDDIEDGYVTFTQCGTTVLEKNVWDDDVDVTDGRIGFTLSQEETLALPTGNIKMQIRLLLSDGRAVASYNMETTVDDIMKDGVI